jgi:hypothetical protein
MWRLLELWGRITAPIHELGHVIFGWLSFNPTSIVAWNYVASNRYGFTVQIGGYLFEAIVGAVLAWKLRRYLWVYPVAIIQVSSMLYCINYQGDFIDSTAPGAMLIWRLSGVLAYIVILYSFIASREEKRLGIHSKTRPKGKK